MDIVDNQNDSNQLGDYSPELFDFSYQGQSFRFQNEKYYLPNTVFQIERK